MPKAVMIDPAEMRSKQVLYVFADPAQPIQPQCYRRACFGRLHQGRSGSHPARHDDHPRVREDARRGQEAGALQGASNTTTAARRISRSARKRRPSGRRICSTRTITSSARTAATARFWPRASRRFAKLSDEPLMSIMAELFRRRFLRVVEKDATGIDARIWRSTSSSTARWRRSSRARRASTAAWAARCTPSSRRSASIPTTPSSAARRILPSGAALFKHVNRKPGIVIANIGDASAGCGPVWEAHLLRRRWISSRNCGTRIHRGGLPLIMNFVNNFYGMGGQPVGETMGFKVLARIGAGVDPEPDARRARRRLQPAGGHRRHPPQEEIIERGRRPGAARHGDLSLQRPLAVGCQLVSREDRSRSVAAGRSDQHVCRQSDRGRRLHAGRASTKCRLGSMRSILQGLPEGDRSDRSRRGPIRRTLAACWSR